MTAQSVREGTVLWEPSDEIKNQAITTKYINWLKTRKGLSFNDYNSLWQWSVTEIEDFWQSLWEFFEIKVSKPFAGVLPERKMPGARVVCGLRAQLCRARVSPHDPEPCGINVSIRDSAVGGNFLG